MQGYGAPTGWPNPEVGGPAPNAAAPAGLAAPAPPNTPPPNTPLAAGGAPKMPPDAGAVAALPNSPAPAAGAYVIHIMHDNIMTYMMRVRSIK